ncbi:MAG: hypothetical protein GF375_06895 [Candidatus Omnitrophica bacterium]|nr:hypothetical protein [Candidatus Omnitrophota bacterium]MBD3269703.1 hypothetical protein [Candidatus Omnitrophota bacterium]
MNTLDDKKRVIRQKAEEILQDLGFELVDFKMFFSSGVYIVRCLADYPEGGIKMDDCARANKLIFKFLDNSDIAGDDFKVEVNSPGLNRPLRELKDFARTKGRDVSLWLKEPLEGVKYLEGVIEDTGDGFILFRSRGNKSFKIELDKVSIAKEKIRT